jgi:hypothetical protein
MARWRGVDDCACGLPEPAAIAIATAASATRIHLRFAHINAPPLIRLIRCVSVYSG